MEKERDVLVIRLENWRSKMTVKLSFTKVESVNVSDQEIINGLKERLYVSDLQLIDGVVHRCDRVNWTDYDYVPIEATDVQVKKLKVLTELVDLMNSSRNIRDEEVSI